MTNDVARAELTALIGQAAGGDEAALALVYARTSGKLNALLCRMLNDEQAAAEVLQDVYLTVWRRGSTYDPDRASPVTWLVTIARNRAIDRLRSRKARVLMSEQIEESTVHDPGPSALDKIDHQQTQRRLEDCLTTLEPRQQAAIRAAFFDGLTYEALAAQSGRPLSTVKSTIRRGLLRLRACLDS